MTLAGCHSKPRTETVEEADKLEVARGLHDADKHGKGEHN